MKAAEAPKMIFRQNSADHQFFRPARANFITHYGPVETYKPKNPSGWHYLLEKPSPENVFKSKFECMEPNLICTSNS